jgi:hypothetical protein
MASEALTDAVPGTRLSMHAQDASAGCAARLAEVTHPSRPESRRAKISMVKQDGRAGPRWSSSRRPQRFPDRCKSVTIVLLLARSKRNENAATPFSRSTNPARLP